MVTFIIYKYTNTINGKHYIGKTSKSFIERHKQHLYNASVQRPGAFYKAINKYGIDAFTTEIIVEKVPHYMSSAFEKYWIHYYQAYTKGYNLTIGGEGMVGYKISEEARKKLSVKGKNYRHSEESKKKISHSNLGKIVPPETRQKISNTLSGKGFFAKSANIYNAITHELIAKNVCLQVWCKENGYQRTHLSNTALGKLQKYRNLYARYN